MGVSTDPVTFDPHNYRHSPTQSLLGNVYEGPFMRLPGGTEFLPALVKEWTQIDDVTYEAVFRDDVRFHSGDLMTIEDVKFSFDRVLVENAMDGKTSPRKQLAGPIASTEIVGANTLRIKLSDPSPRIKVQLSNEAGIVIVNKSFTEAAGPGGLATKSDGTGPFRIASANPGDRVVLERHPDYYGGPAEPGPAGPARLDTVIFRTIPDTSSRIAALIAGEIDIATDIPSFLRSQIEQSGNADVVVVPGTRTFYISLNLTKAPFDDIRVRHALNHAIDRDLIISRAMDGLATPVNGVLSPAAFGASPLPAYGYDPARARQLLAEAGLANGVDLTIDTTGINKDLAEILAQQLAEVGVRTTVQIWESSLFTAMTTDKAKRAERDMIFMAWQNGILDPSGSFVTTLSTTGVGNYSGFSNPEVDDLLTRAGVNTDPVERAAQYAKAEQIVNREAPWVFLWVPQDIYGVNKRVRDWMPLSNSAVYMHRATVQ